MSVINTNTLSLVTQNNLTKSQGALNSAIERLSSGMRINSAKDDSAGQAIANRFSASIKGLTQASRNANDGISLAQTTEGALNEVNNNLQRVRELAVQASNGSNSAADKASIQGEITARLDEINRISSQTDFNGVKVLSSSAAKLDVQVGAADGQIISIDLEEISQGTLGLTGFDAKTMVTSNNLGTSLTSSESLNVIADVQVDGNAGTKIAADGVYALSSNTPAVKFTGVTDALNLANTTTAGNTAIVSYDDAGTTKYAAITGDPGSVSAAVAVSVNADGTFGITAGADLIAADITKINAGSVSVTEGGTKTAAVNDYAVKGSDGSYYAAAVATNGDVSWDSSTSAVLDSAVDVAGGAVNTVRNGATSTTAPAGLAAGETLSEILNADKTGTGTYIVKGGTSAEPTYNTATLAFDATSGAVTVTKGAAATVDPMAMLDRALAKVDGLRGSLGAVQNRFDSAIANLGTTIVNQSSARSRIEDADYAVEVSNMTRAQILQQAGTSVLAKANSSTEGVMSLLR